METQTLVHIGSHKKICPSTILMFKADINYTEVHLADGSQYLSSTSIGKLEKRLENLPFFRPNRSFIINLNFAEFIEENSELKVNNEQSIAVSRRRKPLLLHILNKN